MPSKTRKRFKHLYKKKKLRKLLQKSEAEIRQQPKFHFCPMCGRNVRKTTFSAKNKMCFPCVYKLQAQEAIKGDKLLFIFEKAFGAFLLITGIFEIILSLYNWYQFFYPQDNETYSFRELAQVIYITFGGLICVPFGISLLRLKRQEND